MTVGRPRWSAARRVLCVRLDTLGDVLMTGPAMRALRESGAEPHVTLLTSPPGAAIAELMPEVDETIEYEAPWMKRGQGDADADADRAMIGMLRARGFDAAVIFTVCTQSALPAALMCRLADVPLRLAHSREKPYGLLTDHIADAGPREPARHEVRRQLDLVASVGAATADERLAVEVPAGARDEAATLLHGLGVETGRPWAAVHPGASAPSRRYPPELWAAVCRGLAENGVQVVLTGDAAEVTLAGDVLRAADLEGHSLAGRLGLGTLAALLDAAPVLVAGNTGPVHLAAAVGTPVVDVYALTNPQHTPWRVPSRVLSYDVPCRWCLGSVCREGHHMCLRGVEPAQVVSAAIELGRFVGAASRAL
jgi:lipopolysaccharide heptosyltransferase II